VRALRDRIGEIGTPEASQCEHRKRRLRDHRREVSSNRA
jgi:hypothetical protein